MALVAVIVSLATLVGVVGTVLGFRGVGKLSDLRKEMEGFLTESRKANEKEKKDIDGLCKALETEIDLDIAYHYRRTGDYLAILDICKAIASDDSVDDRMKGRAYSLFAWAYKRLSRVRTAFDMSLQAVELFEKVEKEKAHPVTQPNLKATALFNTACYASLDGDFKSAEIYLVRALAMRPDWHTAASKDDDFRPFRYKHQEVFDRVIAVAKEAQRQSDLGQA